MEAVEFRAVAESVRRPHCGYWNDGLLGDPRGKEAECDHCGKPFRISHEAEALIE